jgi:hypothetical protein
MGRVRRPLRRQRDLAAGHAVVRCSGPITSGGRTDYIGGFGTTLAENIRARGTTLCENETTLRENSPITSAANHIS